MGAGDPTPKDPIQVFYPNGGNQAVQVYIWDTNSSQPILWDGSVTGGGGVASQVEIVASIPLDVTVLNTTIDVVVTNPVSVTVSNTVTVQATNLDIRDLVFATDKVDVTGSVVTATVSNSTLSVVGNIAHDSPDSGNPVKIGAVATTTLPAVTDADRTNAISDLSGRLFVRTGREGPASAFFNINHVPSVNTVATTSQPALASTRNVVTGFVATLAAGTTAPAAIQVAVNVIDGASGGTTYLFRSVMSLPAVAGAMSAIVRGNLWLPASVNTTTTIEFSAAGGANTFESVSLEGVKVPSA